MNRIFFWLSLLMPLAGCNESDDDPATPLLTVSVDGSFSTSDTDNWIMIHDEAGTLLDFKNFETNDEFTLDSDRTLSGNTIGITLLSYVTFQDQEFYLLNSYLNVEKGKMISIRPNPFTEVGDYLGSFNIVVEALSDPDQYCVSSKYAYATTSGTISNNDLSLNCSLYSKAANHLLQLTDATGTLKYKVFENVKQNDSYSLTIEDMSPFDKIVEFSFPQCDDVSLNVYGREADQSFVDRGYVINNHIKNDSHTKIKAGYLNSLAKYETKLYLNYTDFSYVYSNTGAIPNGNIPWPSKSDFVILNREINNFSATVEVPFIYRRTFWRYDSPANSPMKAITWFVSSSSATQVLIELPSDIVSAHPLLNFENLRHSSTTFYTQSEPYSAYLDREFNKEMGPSEPQVGITLY